MDLETKTRQPAPQPAARVPDPAPRAGGASTDALRGMGFEEGQRALSPAARPAPDYAGVDPTKAGKPTASSGGLHRDVPRAAMVRWATEAEDPAMHARYDALIQGAYASDVEVGDRTIDVGFGNQTRDGRNIDPGLMAIRDDAALKAALGQPGIKALSLGCFYNAMRARAEGRKPGPEDAAFLAMADEKALVTARQLLAGLPGTAGVVLPDGTRYTKADAASAGRVAELAQKLMMEAYRLADAGVKARKLDPDGDNMWELNLHWERSGEDFTLVPDVRLTGTKDPEREEAARTGGPGAPPSSPAVLADPSRAGPGAPGGSGGTPGLGVDPAKAGPAPAGGPATPGVAIAPARTGPGPVGAVPGTAGPLPGTAGAVPGTAVVPGAPGLAPGTPALQPAGPTPAGGGGTGTLVAATAPGASPAARTGEGPATAPKPGWSPTGGPLPGAGAERHFSTDRGRDSYDTSRFDGTVVVMDHRAAERSAQDNFGGRELWKADRWLGGKRTLTLCYKAVKDETGSYVVFTEPESGMRARVALQWDAAKRQWNFPGSLDIQMEAAPDRPGADEALRKLDESARQAVLLAVRFAVSDDYANGADNIVKYEDRNQKAAMYGARLAGP